MVCRDILCHENRKMDKGMCVHPTEDYVPASKECISIFLKLTPVNDILSFDDISVIFSENLLYDSLILNIKNFEEIAVEIQVYGKSDTSNMLEYIMVYLVVKTENDIIQSFLKLDKTNFTLNTKSGEVYKRFNVKLGLYDIEQFDNYSFISLTDELDFAYHTIPFMYERLNGNVTCEKGKTIVLNRLTLCPFITFAITEMSVTIEGDVIIINGGWDNMANNVVLSRWGYELHGDQIYVCLDTFIDIYNKIPTADKLTVEIAGEVEAKQIVSFVCVCLSIVCLVLTIITYLRFRKLQSQPGMNTIILCCSLLLAQAFYQFGAGQKSLSDWACALIGALCHFLWLSVMFAMNTCSIHMFTIFKKHRQMLPRFRWRTTAKSILYIVGFSLLFVIINIVVSFTIRNENLGGYGGRVCYISSNIMQIITFLIPVAVTLIGNLLLFSYVVLRISKTSTSSPKLNQERSYFLIYTRLSTMTGLTWIFGFLQLFLKHDILEYIFIILNAGQGIFIMIAFVLNKRVLSMYFSKGKVVVSDQTGPSALPIKSDENTKGHQNMTNFS